jgi:hypothetical protein
MLVRELMKGLLIATCCLTMVGVAEAASTIQIDAHAFSKHPSPLPAGARIVAGNLNQNEFFILGPEARVVAPVTRLASKDTQAKLKAVLVATHVKRAAPIKLVASNKKHRLPAVAHNTHRVTKKRLAMVSHKAKAKHIHV